MRKALCLILFVASCSSPSYGQHLWERFYGGTDWDFGHSVLITEDGGYLIAGRTMSFGAGGEDLYLVKTDSYGDTVWTRTYGGSNSDGACCVQHTTDGGYIIAGRTISFGAGYVDLWLVKTDSLGDTLWTRTFGTALEEWGYYVQQTFDGGYIVVGYQMFSAGEGDVWLIKTDSQGMLEWDEHFGGANYDEARAVQQTPDGGYVLVGTDDYNTSNAALYLVKTDSLGVELWSKHYGGPLMDYGLGISLTSDGGFIITGKKNISCIAGEAYIIRADSLGDSLWTRTFGDSADDYAHCARQTDDGGYIVCGARTNRETYYSNGYLIKLDGSGDSLWTRAYGATNYANFFSVHETPDSGFICVGSIYINDDYNIYAVRSNREGNVAIREPASRTYPVSTQRLLVLPNPFVSEAVALGCEDESILVYDITGRLLDSYPGHSIGKELHPGVYILKVKGSGKMQKIVKVR